MDDGIHPLRPDSGQVPERSGRTEIPITPQLIMSYVVHVTAVVEGDTDQIEALMNEYRYNCLANQPGMEQFYICRHLEQENVFLYTQVFKDAEAHKAHMEGGDPQWFFEQMEENSFHFQGRWVAGQEIDSSAGQILN